MVQFLYVRLNWSHTLFILIDRCVKADTCKIPKILGENLDPHDAIDIRKIEIQEEGTFVRIRIEINKKQLQ